MVFTIGDYDEKCSGAWAKVPVWDGSPATWRSFKREVAWWVSSLDIQSTKEFNLAARFLLRQTGIVRQRGEEFTPEQLEYKQAVMITDPETGEQFETEPEDCLAGLNKLMKVFEEINGLTSLDKEGELRALLYLGSHRKAGERVTEYCTRFCTMVGDLRAERGETFLQKSLGGFSKRSWD